MTADRSFYIQGETADEFVARVAAIVDEIETGVGLPMKTRALEQLTRRAAIVRRASRISGILILQPGQLAVLFDGRIAFMTERDGVLVESPPRYKEVPRPRSTRIMA